MNKESFNFLQDLIEKKSIEIQRKFCEIIENELKIIHEEYGIPKDKLILQCYPEGTYSIAVIVSKFRIDHEFITKPDPPKETE